jgi:flagellar biogenesis protein FliO
MAKELWTLAWALPAVLILGLVAALVLRRFYTNVHERESQRCRLHLSESLTLSEETRVHLIAIDGETHVLVESARNATLQFARSPLALARRRPWTRSLWPLTEEASRA